MGRYLVNLLSPKQAAAILAISERTLRRLTLPPVRFGKHLTDKPWFEPHDFADTDGAIRERWEG
jgi:hypothetical protein